MGSVAELCGNVAGVMNVADGSSRDRPLDGFTAEKRPLKAGHLKAGSSPLRATDPLRSSGSVETGRSVGLVGGPALASHRSVTVSSRHLLSALIEAPLGLQAACRA